MAETTCGRCGEDADFPVECEDCGENLCERCYGDTGLVICRDCQRNERFTEILAAVKDHGNDQRR